MFFFTSITYMYMAKVTMLRGKRNLAEMASHDILNAVHKIHGQSFCKTYRYMYVNTGKNNICVLKIYIGIMHTKPRESTCKNE